MILLDFFKNYPVWAFGGTIAIILFILNQFWDWKKRNGNIYIDDTIKVSVEMIMDKKRGWIFNEIDFSLRFVNDSKNDTLLSIYEIWFIHDQQQFQMRFTNNGEYFYPIHTLKGKSALPIQFKTYLTGHQFSVGREIINEIYVLVKYKLGDTQYEFKHTWGDFVHITKDPPPRTSIPGQ